MHRKRLSTGLTVAFAGMSAVLAVVGALTNPVALVVAAVFAAVAGVLWYQASGRLASRVYRRVERQAAVDGGAGPRAEWTGPHRRGRTRRPPGGDRVERPADDGGLTAREASAVLDVEPDADAEAVRAAYRERIKDVHPDAPGGDEAAFRRVRTAYERLSD